MKAILCVDDNNGMLFNKRRQSQDRQLRDYVRKRLGGDKLWMSCYSYGQFKGDTDKEDSDKGDTASNLIVDDRFLDKAPAGEYCFIEDTDISQHLAQMEEVLLFKWNRTYPADTYCPVCFREWKLVEMDEFIGHSHEKITLEIYRR